MEPTASERSEFLKAFNKCQGIMAPAKWDSENPHFKSKYASLGSVMEAVKPFVENGFSFIHGGVEINGNPYLRTKIVHISGAEESCDFPLTPDGNIQHMAAQISYLRRYSIGCLTGLIIDTDDDGNAAAMGKKAAEPAAYTEKKAAEKAAITPGQDELAQFVPSKVEFEQGRGKGAGQTFSAIYSPDGTKYGGDEIQGELAEAARGKGQAVAISFSRKGVYNNIKRGGLVIAGAPEPDAF